MTWWIRIVLGLHIDMKDRFADVDAFIRHDEPQDLHRIEAGRIQIRKERHSTARLRIPCVEFHGIALRWQATPLPPLYVRSQDLVRCAITVTVLHPSLRRPQKPGPRLRRYPTLTSRLGYVLVVLRRDHPHDHGLRQLDSFARKSPN